MLHSLPTQPHTLGVAGFAEAPSEGGQQHQELKLKALRNITKYKYVHQIRQCKCH